MPVEVSDIIEAERILYSLMKDDVYEYMKRMKMCEFSNLQVSDNALIGNKFNGHDLHLYLREHRIESEQLVLNPEFTNNDSYFFLKNQSQQTKFMELERNYSVHAMLYPNVLDIMYNKLFLGTDIVHYHLIHNYFFNMNLFPIMTRLKPSVWTIHDPWALSGHCIHHFDCDRWQKACGDCPALDIPFPMPKDNTALNFELKRQALQNSKLSLIVASNWMKEKVQKSPIAKDLPLYHVPFGINQELFKPGSIKEAKNALGIDEKSFTLMFRSEPNPYKGIDIIKVALAKIKAEEKATLITVGLEKRMLEEFEGRFNIIEFGWLKDDKKLIELYQACDIFLMPSKQEAFGMMAIEAMSCGKPVLSIKGTALEDTINSPHCGLAVEPDAGAYTKELQRLMDNPTEILERGQKSLEFARKNYCHKVYTDRMIKVYRDVISRHKIDDEAKYVLEQLKKHMQQEPLKRIEDILPSGKNSLPVKGKKSILLKILYRIALRPVLKIIHGREKVRQKYDKRFS